MRPLARFGTIGALLLAAAGGCSSPASEADPTRPPSATGEPPAKSQRDPSPLGFDLSNVDLTGIPLAELGELVVSTPDCQIDTEGPSVSCRADAAGIAFSIVTQPDGSKVGVYVARTIRIDAGASLAVLGKLPLVLVATDTIEIFGALEATAEGENAVAGGSVQTIGNTKGAGAGGGGAGSDPSSAGGGSYCGTGGAGAALSGSPAPGGTPWGSDALSPLHGGSPGGAGWTGIAGAGGGAVELVAGTSVHVAKGGSVSVGGGGGGSGGTGPNQRASGGGSGGSILIESRTVTIAGTLAANGGGGGQGDAGSEGEAGQASAEPARSAVGASAAAGGTGSSGAQVDGGNGAASDSLTGGGGGGAGRIRINSEHGAADIGGATLSPGKGACSTEGSLAGLVSD